MPADARALGAAIVTGGGGGIGAAVARRFAAAGYGVVVNDIGVTVEGNDPSRAPADMVVAAIHDAGGRAVAHHASVTDDARVGELVELAVTRFGGLEALVTCHGILRERMIFNMTELDWDAVVDVHLKGAFLCFRHATARMRQQKKGSIIALTSAAGLEGSPAQANYAAAKAGIVGLAFSTALAMGKYGVNVNCVAPSARTRMTSRLTDKMANTRPEVERGGAELIAGLCVALADPRMRHVTGQVLTATGRRVARWTPPTEQPGVELDGAVDQEQLSALVLDEVGVSSLRRFAALGLPQPASLG